MTEAIMRAIAAVEDARELVVDDESDAPLRGCSTVADELSEAVAVLERAVRSTRALDD